MGVYRKCPRCGNDEIGDSIWTCQSCGCVHCKECDPENGQCPECNGHVDKVGYIEEEDEDSDDTATYRSCPRCGNEEEGAGIWECKSCGCVHCKECDPENGQCPNCNGHVRKIGYIRED
jgi:hypothetical protein